jgi:sugar lactone lactonase YvrE
VSAPAELVVDARCAVGESPVWQAAEQALYWVDILGRRLYRWRAVSNAVTHWTVHEMIGCIASHRGGGFIAAMETGMFRLIPKDDGNIDCERLVDVEHPNVGMRFNDGRCDRQGRFWAGTMALDMATGDRSGSMYRYERDGELVRVVDGFIVPNGLAFSPDGRRMYMSDSHPTVQRIWTFDYDVDTGTPSARRLFFDMNSLPGRPDGAAVDEDGCYWICGNDAGLIHRISPDGALDRSLSVPVPKPAMCAFGGAQLDTLFVTSIRPVDMDPSDRSPAGGIFALRPGVRGLEEPSFGMMSSR